MKNISLAIFDLDGTLLDTSDGIISSVKFTIEKLGLGELKDAELETFIGPPIQASFSRFFDLEDDKLQEAVSTFRNHYKEYDLLKAIPYQGIYHLFEVLKENNIIPAVATYKRQDYAEIILKYFEFAKYTNLFFGADIDGKLKKQDIIRNCIKTAGIDNVKKVVMVGDSDNDAVGALALDVPFLGVTYGFGFKTIQDVLKYEPIGVAASVDEIAPLILK